MLTIVYILGMMTVQAQTQEDRVEAAKKANYEIEQESGEDHVLAAGIDARNLVFIGESFKDYDYMIAFMHGIGQTTRDVMFSEYGFSYIIFMSSSGTFKWGEGEFQHFHVDN